MNEKSISDALYAMATSTTRRNQMAELFGEFKVTLVGKAFLEYSEYYRRLNAQLEDEMTLAEFNKQIYLTGMRMLIQAIHEVENENKIC